MRQAGLVELLALVPGVTLLADAGYQGLSAQTAGAAITPRPARRKYQLPLFPAVAAAHEAERHAHSAQRIRVEHGISHLKNWRALSRHRGRREHLDTILPAIAGLVSSQERAPRPAPLHSARSGCSGLSVLAGTVLAAPPRIFRRLDDDQRTHR